ncbi:hypothetical protein BGZ68_001661 [Mortierella alpina]|nr:hypothetical protein BGZ68_001661 [Mortierella alpina]
MEHWPEDASASDPRLAAESGTRFHASTAQAQPPVLSFRAFHSRHFSSAQRQAFFGVSAPVPAWYQHPLWSQTCPVEEDTIGHPDCVDEGREQTEYTNGVLEGGSALDQDQPQAPQLSKEAIEIFEFSRRFKREKAEAALREQTRLKKRRVKRRKLTRLGLAADEGNSGSGGSDHESHSRIHDLDGGDSSAQKDEHNADSDDETEEEEDVLDTAEQELPAMDTTFLHQRSRQRERTRQQLYGHIAGSTLEGGLARIDVLEAMLNASYEESLGSRSAEDSGSTGRKGKSHGNRVHTVYWPGVPLRC